MTSGSLLVTSAGVFIIACWKDPGCRTFLLMGGICGCIFFLILSVMLMVFVRRRCNARDTSLKRKHETLRQGTGHSSNNSNAAPGIAADGYSTLERTSHQSHNYDEFVYPNLTASIDEGSPYYMVCRSSDYYATVDDIVKDREEKSHYVTDNSNHNYENIVNNQRGENVTVAKK